MYKIIIFGTGKYYENRKNNILDNEIVGFLDNDCSKQHQLLDGKTIYSPSELERLRFDYILLMSLSAASMRSQLLDMGIAKEKIIDYEHYLKPYTEMKVFCTSTMDGLVKQGKLVLLVSHELSNTGAPIVLLYMAKLMQKNGYYPVIISREDGALKKDILSERIPLIICEELKGNNFIFRILLKVARLAIFNTLNAGYLLKDNVGLCKKYVWWLHEGEASYHEEIIANSKILAKTDINIYAVSELTKKVFLKYAETGKVSRVFPYGIPDMGYKRKKSGEKLKFLLAGTISKRKGQDIMMEAISKLTNEELVRAEFIFAGSIAEKEVYEKIKECNLEQVVYKGELNTHEMQELYEGIDVVVCPSREDPLPVVLTEGMMNRKVCIMSDNTGTASMINDRENGLICKAGDAKSLADQIKWVLCNTEKLDAIRQNGRQLYERIFTMEAFEKRILDIISE